MPNITDVEIYSDYSLVMQRDLVSGAVRYWEQYPGRPWDIASLKAGLQEDTVIGFNSSRYDLPILRIALAGADSATLKEASDAIIVHDTPPWRLGDTFKMDGCVIDSIDIMEPTPGVQVSLKTYAGRIGAPKMQDLPIDPSASIRPVDRPVLRQYCLNDLMVTTRLYHAVEDRIRLREQMSDQYGIDLRSKSDAQIAEAVIKSEVETALGHEVKRPKINPGTAYRYRAPKFIDFETPLLQDVLRKVKAADFVVAESGSIDIPKDLANFKIKIGGSTYQLGIGGLHSTESRTAHRSDEHYVLLDHDVASYYPSIILRCKLYPAHMTAKFLDVYRSIVERRLAAKIAMKSGDESAKVVQESLKIVLNGSFGKFGSKYSILYAPNLLIQTTITGQLALLQLIERLEMVGIPVVSANTDGIVIKCPRGRQDEMGAIVRVWEFFSGFEMERTEYAALYSKDVNNYIAVKSDGKVKLKGLYAEPGLMKNPTGTIAVDAVVANLTTGADVRETILASKDIGKFVTIRTVSGGGVQGDQYLGKTVRWYYAIGGTSIHYKKNGNKVAKSDGARAVMELPQQFPGDIDYEVYVAEAEAILKSIGAK